MSAEAIAPRPGAMASHEDWVPRVNPWLITIAVMLGTFMEVLDTTIVATALPHIAGNLSATTEESTWVLTSYLVSNAIILPASGWLALRFGRKRLLMFCIGIFIFSSFLCGAAVTLGMLVAARVIQGIGGGVMQPLSQAILLESFPLEKRGMAMAAYGMGVVTAPIHGPTLGGWLTDDYTWRLAFYINIPVGILAIFLISMFVDDPPYIRDAKPGRVDAFGFGLMALGLGTLQIFLDKGQIEDWFASPFIRALTVIWVTGLLAFVFWELRQKEPIVNLRIFLNRNFAVATTMMLAVAVVLFSATTIQPLFLQTLMGYPALKSGLTVSPRGFGSMTAMIFVGYLTAKIDNRYILAFGVTMLAFSMFLLGDINLQIAPWNVTGPTILSGLAMGCIFVPLSAMSVRLLPRREIGNATGLFSLMRNIGGSLGISVVTTLLARRAQVHQSEMVGRLAAGDLNFGARMGSLSGYLGTRFDPATAARKAQGVLYNELVRQSTLHAFVDNFRYLALVAAACFLMIFLFKKVAPGRDTPPKVPR